MKILFTLLLVSFASFCMAQYDADRHNTSYNKGWITCETNDSPNLERGNSAWIMYDFGQIYALGETKIWNTNVADFTNIGIKTMAIDFSTDGENWESFGEAEIEIANASNFYTGINGPDLTGIEARYILITALTNHGGDCVGFSEIKFSTTGVVTDVVDIDELEGDLNIFPNPMNGAGNVELINIPAGEYIYYISDLQGRIVMRSKTRVSSSKQIIQLDVTRITNGIYNFTIEDGARLKSRTIEIMNN